MHNAWWLGPFLARLKPLEHFELILNSWLQLIPYIIGSFTFQETTE